GALGVGRWEERVAAPPDDQRRGVQRGELPVLEDFPLTPRTGEEAERPGQKRGVPRPGGTVQVLEEHRLEARVEGLARGHEAPEQPAGAPSARAEQQRAKDAES